MAYFSGVLFVAWTEKRYMEHAVLFFGGCPYRRKPCAGINARRYAVQSNFREVNVRYASHYFLNAVSHACASSYKYCASIAPFSATYMPDSTCGERFTSKK